VAPAKTGECAYDVGATVRGAPDVFQICSYLVVRPNAIERVIQVIQDHGQLIVQIVCHTAGCVSDQFQSLRVPAVVFLRGHVPRCYSMNQRPSRRETAK
jgi:hypothetical protein